MSVHVPDHRRLPLTLQLASILSLAAIGLAFVIAFVVTDRERRAAERDVHGIARRAGTALARRAAPLLESGDDLRLAVLAASVADMSAARVLLLGEDGVVRLDTGLTLGGTQLEIETDDGVVERPVEGGSGAWEILIPSLANSGFVGEVRMRYRPSDVPVTVFAWDVFGVALLLGASLVLLAWWIVHQWLVRVRAVSGAVRELGAGEVFESSPDTPAIGELGDALQEAGRRIEEERVRARESGFDLARRLTRQLEQRGLAVIGHGDRTRRYAMLIAEAARLPADEWQDLGNAAVLVDLGKAGVRASALEKRAGELDDVERESLRQAPSRAASFLAGLPHATGVARAIRHHHEKYDGTGYPDGLRGERIPLTSRILAIADAYDLLTSTDSGGAGLSWPEALDRMQDDRGEHFDPGLLDAFEQAIRRDPLPARESQSVLLHAVEPTPYQLADEPLFEREEEVSVFDFDDDVELLGDDRDPSSEDARR